MIVAGILAVVPAVVSMIVARILAVSIIPAVAICQPNWSIMGVLRGLR